MKLQALNDYVIVEKIQKKESKIALTVELAKIVNEDRKVKVVSAPLGNDLEEGDIIYITSGSLMNLENFHFLKLHNVIAKEL